MISAPRKLPIEIWNLAVDFAGQLNSGETVTGGDASVEDGDVTVSEIGAAGSALQFTIAGGTSGTTQRLLVSVTTNQGETLAEVVELLVA